MGSPRRAPVRSAAAEQVEREGYAVLPGVLDEARCDEWLGWLDAVWAEHGRPPLCAGADRELSERVRVDPVGLVIADVLARHPELGSGLLDPGLLAALEALLGPRPLLEMACGILSDRRRPFFFWHDHAGGIDGERVRREGGYVNTGRVERVVCTFYLSPVDAAHGELLVLPRALRDPRAPVPARHAGPLPGQRRLSVPRGAAVLFDERTPHAVTPMRRDGVRGFVGMMLVRPDAPPTENRDPSVHHLASLPELRRFLP